MTSPTPVPCMAIAYSLDVTCKDLDRDRMALTQLDHALQWVHVVLAAIKNETHHPKLKQETQKAHQALTDTFERLKELSDATRQLYAAMSDLQTALKQAHTQTKGNHK